MNCCFNNSRAKLLLDKSVSAKTVTFQRDWIFNQIKSKVWKDSRLNLSSSYRLLFRRFWAKIYEGKTIKEHVQNDIWPLKTVNILYRYF